MRMAEMFALVEHYRGRGARLHSRVTHSRFLREFIPFASSTAALQVVRFGISLFAARQLGPEAFGRWGVVSLVLVYGAVVHLGAPNGMGRQVPFLIGAGRRHESAQVEHVALSMTLGATLCATLALLAVPTRLVGIEWQSPLRWMAVAFLASQAQLYAQVYFRAHMRFSAVSLQQALQAAVLAVAAVALTRAFKLEGFIAAQGLAFLAACLPLWRPGHVGVRPGWHAGIAGPLIRIGFPMLAAGIFYGAMTTVDRLVVAYFLEAKALGQYALAAVVLNGLSIAPMIVAQQYFPRMATQYGRAGNRAALRPLLWKQLGLSLMLVVPIVAAGALIVPLAVERFLAAYRPGVAVLQVLLVGLLFLPFIAVTGNVLNSIGRQTQYVLVLAGGTVASLGLCSAAAAAGFGAVGVAAAAATGYGLSGLICLALALEATAALR